MILIKNYSTLNNNSIHKIFSQYVLSLYKKILKNKYKYAYLVHVGTNKIITPNQGRIIEEICFQRHEENLF